MRRTVMPTAFAVLFAATLAAPAGAQQQKSTSSTDATVSATSEGQTGTARSVVQRVDRFEALPPTPAPLTEEGAVAPAQPAMQSFGRDGALMIVGGALLVAGLLIGDDAGTVVAVAGAAIGAYGLYLYIQ